MAMSERRDPNKLDEIRFADGFVPPLPAGPYAIEATQTLTLRTETEKPTFNAQKALYISAPRFTLQPGEVYSVYPPEGQAGSFHTTLPHIVFTRRTLPWERSIDGSAAGSGEPIRRPWMALLTLDDDDIATYPVHLHSVSLSEMRASRKTGEWKTAKLPEFLPEPGERVAPAKEQDHCLVADIPTAKFREIAPALDELTFLAHARQVGTEDKDVADIVADGWFAVVIGNRLPKKGKRNHGLLVSLEGLQNVLRVTRKEGEPPPGLPSEVRLPVLKHWQYVCEGPTFRDLLEALTESGEDKKDVWLRIPQSGRETPNKAVRQALELGYTALTHGTRQGAQTVSWYRGPLIPVPLLLDAGVFPAIHANADEALHYDDGTGLFDVSYAAAWQLGRLLALQKSDFANSLLHRVQGVLRETGEIVRELQADGSTIDEQKAKLLLQDDLMIAILTEWWMAEPDEGGRR